MLSIWSGPKILSSGNGLNGEKKSPNNVLSPEELQDCMSLAISTIASINA